MNKLIYRIIVLIVIVAVLAILLFRVRSPFGKGNSSFASEPVNEITRIEFSQDGNKLVLEDKGDSWVINGKSEARKSGVLFIIRILKEIKIKSPVAADLFKSEVTDKNVSPVKVKVYEKQKNLKTFLVYKTASNTYGNIMKMKESAKPFIVEVPGFDGEIGSAFTLNELFWQSYTVFNLLPSEIASVKFENLSDTAASFTIINKNHQFSLASDTANNSGWNPSNIIRYISYFAWVPFESWAFDMGEAEKIAVQQNTPLFRITVNTSMKKTKVLTLWELSKDSNNTDSDRIIGKTNESDQLFIMRYFDIDPLIKKKSYFYEE